MTRSLFASSRGYMFEVAAFFVISLLVVSALFMTVHRRDIESVEAYKARTSLDRYDLTVQRWLEGGFWRHGGMFVVPRNLALGWYPDQVPPDSQLRTDSLFVYRNGTASYIIPLFWIQGIQQALNGRTSPTATVLYNQIMVALIAVALATLAHAFAGISRFLALRALRWPRAVWFPSRLSHRRSQVFGKLVTSA